MRHLTDFEMSEIGREDADSPLVFFSQEAWTQLQEWSMSPKDLVHVYSFDLVDCTITPKEWLRNEDMDAVMYFIPGEHIFTMMETMSYCLFSVQIKSAYNKFLADKRTFKFDSFLLAYGNGELPPHGRTRKMWDMEVDRIYVPVFVHWILLCINLVHRTIEVFDCPGKKRYKEVEAFTVLIPRIVKAVYSPANKKHLNIGQYSVTYVPMQSGLNQSSCDCGVYALKFIECHLLGLDLSLVNDDNIKEARYKIAVDLFQAANNPVLIDRMSKGEPPPKHVDSNVVDID